MIAGHGRQTLKGAGTQQAKQVSLVSEDQAPVRLISETQVDCSGGSQRPTKATSGLYMHTGTTCNPSQTKLHLVVSIL